MSTADDILEMKGLCSEIADRLAISSHGKDRVDAVCKALKAKVTWNRAFEFLHGRARRIDSWEKDLARAELKQLKRQEQRQRTADTIQWLADIGASAAASGADLDRADLAAVQRVLSRVGSLDRAMGNPGTAAEDEDQTHWGM
jgi:hypothetical protein